MLKLDIGFLSTSLAIFMNNQDPQQPRKTKKNGVKNLKRAYPYFQLHHNKSIDPRITLCNNFIFQKGYIET